MEYSISTTTLIIIAINMTIAFLLPFVLYFVLRAKKSVDAKPFIFGFLVMFLFNLVLKNAASLGIIAVAGDLMDNLWFYGIVGGFMAGLFEEAGRFLAMNFTLKKYQDNDYNAVGYGLGHGGFEIVFILGITMISNITIGYLVSSGNADALFAQLTDPADIAAMDSAIRELCEAAPAMFLISPIERAAAYIAQVALSVVVWFGVKNKDKLALPIAIALHTVIDSAAVISFRLTNSYAVTEILIWLLAIGVAVYAKNVWKMNTKTE